MGGMRLHIQKLQPPQKRLLRHKWRSPMKTQLARLLAQTLSLILEAEALRQGDALRQAEAVQEVLQRWLHKAQARRPTSSKNC